LVIGLYFAHLESLIRRLASSGRFLLALLFFSFPALFVLLTMQYNLRSCVRLIYYSIVFETVTWMVIPRAASKEAAGAPFRIPIRSGDFSSQG